MKYKAFQITPIKRAVEGFSFAKTDGNFQKILDSCNDSLQSASSRRTSIPIYRPANLAVLIEANKSLV